MNLYAKSWEICIWPPDFIVLFQKLRNESLVFGFDRERPKE